MIELSSWEAEEAVLGFLLNPNIDQEKKFQTLQVIEPDYFESSTYRDIFENIKDTQIFDKIVLWDKIQLKPYTSLEWKDVSEIEELITEQELNSYVEILLDRFQRRKMMKVGDKIREEIARGTDPFEVALTSQSELIGLSSRFKLETNQELLDKVLNEDKGDILSSGYKLIDSFIGGYARGMIITIAGDSGHLKTTLALDKAFRMAERNPKIKVAIFSKEMLATDLMKKQIARICGIPMPLIFSQQYDKEFVKKKMMEVEPWASNRIRIINPNSFSGVADIAKIQMTHRFDVWFLDFIQLLEFAKHANNSSDYNIQIGQNMRNLQALALATHSVGIILSQVKKGVEQRRIMKPTISDIEWSGLIKQLSSYIFFSYYPGKYYGFDSMPADHYYLIAEKTRFAESFFLPMLVDAGLGIFTEVDDIDKREKMSNKLRMLIE